MVFGPAAKEVQANAGARKLHLTVRSATCGHVALCLSGCRPYAAHQQRLYAPRGGPRIGSLSPPKRSVRSPVHAKAALPASSRAMGTRNGEQET